MSAFKFCFIGLALVLLTAMCPVASGSVGTWVIDEDRYDIGELVQPASGVYSPAAGAVGLHRLVLNRVEKNHYAGMYLSYDSRGDQLWLSFKGRFHMDIDGEYLGELTAALTYTPDGVTGELIEDFGTISIAMVNPMIVRVSANFPGMAPAEQRETTYALPGIAFPCEKHQSCSGENVSGTHVPLYGIAPDWRLTIKGVEQAASVAAVSFERLTSLRVEGQRSSKFHLNYRMTCDTDNGCDGELLDQLVTDRDCQRGWECGIFMIWHGHEREGALLALKKQESQSKWTIAKGIDARVMVADQADNATVVGWGWLDALGSEDRVFIQLAPTDTRRAFFFGSDAP